MENFVMLYVHFKEQPLISSIGTKNRSPRSKHSKRSTQIQINQNEKPNPTKGTAMHSIKKVLQRVLDWLIYKYFYRCSGDTIVLHCPMNVFTMRCKRPYYD